MKKIQLLLVLVGVAFASCKKNETPNQDSNVAKYVKTIEGSFVAKEGDVTLKRSNPNLTVAFERTWTMYAKNSLRYTPAVFGLIDGREFITGSSAYTFWHTSGNNPVTFPKDQAVYSNNTPAEPLRLITETKNADHHVAYLGMLDFEPSNANFPLTIHCYRLGDVLKINTNALTSLPGGNNLSFSVKYNLVCFDLDATKNKLTLSGTNTGVPNGNEFTWADIQYCSIPTQVIETIPTGSAGAGDYTIFDGIGGRVISVEITITETGTGTTPGSTKIVNVPFTPQPGKGMRMELTTSKIGWYDSQTIKWSDTDIEVNTKYVPIN